MATAPQPSRPPIPPQPPRKASHLAAIALLILALVVLVAGLTLWIGVRVLSRVVRVHVQEGGAGKKEISIKTPVGSLEVAKDVNEAGLGLPLYPGARRLNDHESATVNMNLPDEQKLRVLAAKFETSDPVEKVRSFYQQRIGNEVTKFTERDSDGKTVFEIKRKDQEKVVALKTTSGGTRIELVRVEYGRGETN